jgi:hypothetical protein
MNPSAVRWLLYRYRLAAILLAWFGLATGFATAADIGAATSGEWSSAATWTNGVPGPSDSAYIGSTYPTGSAATATVTLSQNTSAGIVFLADGMGTAGTLDLNGFTLSAGALMLGVSGPGTLLRTGGGTLSLAGQLTVNATAPFTFVPGDIVADLAINDLATAATVAAGNITKGTSVVQGGTLNLGTDLMVASGVHSQGTLNANGYALSAPTINLGGHLNNRGPITTTNLTVNNLNFPQTSAFNLTTADAVTNLTLNNDSTTLPAGVTVQSLNLGNQGGGGSPGQYTATTSSVGNVTGSAGTGVDTALILGANLNLTGTLALYGTLNANGHAITASAVTVVFGDVLTPLQNDGLVTVGAWSQTGGTRVQLNQPGDALGSLLLASYSNQGSPVLTIGDAAGQTTGLTIGGQGASAISIDASSDLILDVNGLASGWVFRWADPAGGDHIADLQALINAGELTFSYSNGGSYSITSDGSYTYVNVIPVPEPSALQLVGCAGLAAAAAHRRRVR